MFIAIERQMCSIENRNQYAGYGPVRSEDGRSFFLKGAPRLHAVPVGGETAAGRFFLTDDNSKSVALLEELSRCGPVGEWGRYLTGHFIIAVVDPRQRSCRVITDLGNSYHLFVYRKSADAVYFSTDIDRLSRAEGARCPVDYVSIVDYLTQQSISFPYTFYRGIVEVRFGSCISVEYGSASCSMQETQYWQPRAGTKSEAMDIEGLARQLRKGLLEAAQQILADKKNIGLFLSGGVDSRVLAGILCELGKTATAITCCDEVNDEVEIARAVAFANGHSHRILVRDIEHYPRTLNEFLKTEGPHFVFTRSSYLGFRKEIDAFGFDALLGGYMSDTLLKLHEANVVAKRFLGRHLGTLECFDRTDVRFLRGGADYLKRFEALFIPELLAEVGARRRRNLAFWEELRPDGSAWEWSYMWPFMRNKHNPNLTTHIFNYPAFELYTERASVEVARVASQKIKINGRLFNRAMFPLMKRAADIPLATGMLPLVPNAFLNEFRIGLKHFLPRRLMFRRSLERPLSNPVATRRSNPNLYKLWEVSGELACLRREYNPGSLQRGLLRRGDFNVFDPAEYRGISAAMASHIMYTLLYLDIWARGLESEKRDFLEKGNAHVV